MVEKGSVIQFGALDWMVLDVMESKALLLSQNIIILSALCSDAYVRWDDDESFGSKFTILQPYHNSAFLNYFSAEERGRIVEKVSLPSEDEVKKYLPLPADRVSRLYADRLLNYADLSEDTKKHVKIFDGDTYWWWLGTSVNLEYGQCGAKTITSNGDIECHRVDQNGGGVRPTLWINTMV